MTKHLIIASRFLLKHLEYSLVNIGGLTLGLVIVFFIALYLHDELSFDRIHADAVRIYRVVEHTTGENGEESDRADVAFLLSSVPADIPEVEATVKFLTFGRRNVSNDENTNVFHEDYTVTEQSFFEIFDYPLLQGDRNTALTKPYSVVLSQIMAEKLFGTSEVVGKALHLNGEDQPYQVTGVLKNFPSNTHLQFNMLYSMESLASRESFKRLQASDWSSDYFPTYYKLKPGVEGSSVSDKVTALVKSKRPADANPFHFWLQPITDIHFYSANVRGGYNAKPGEIYYVYIFAAVGLFVLIIACVNYINLATAFSISRGKEVGIKKVAGAHQSQLIGQFITESTFIALASVLLSIFVVNILLPSYNAFTGKTTDVELLFRLPSLLLMIVFTLVVGVLSGSYPAFHLSRLNAVTAIKGFSKNTQHTAALRKGLVVFQFTLSIMLIIASITAYRQIQFIRNKNLGFNEQQLVVLDINSGKVRRGAETIKTELSRIPATKSVSVTTRVPGDWKNLAQAKVTTTENPVGANFYFLGADEDFLRTFEVELTKGRNFLHGKSDSLGVLINETAAQLLGVTEPGYEMTIPSVNLGGSDEVLDQPFRVTVLGITKDFNFQSLHQKIAPLVIGHPSNPIQPIDYFTVRLEPGDLEGNLKAMEKVIKQIDPDHPLEYNFLDQRLADFYREDLMRGKLFGIAAMISIALTCLGLFSLVSFSTEQRTKEIGVRKVLGASVTQVTMMLSLAYVKLVAIGFLLAAPFSIWALQGWLSSFAYRIEIGWVMLVVACLLSLTITLLTVSFKSIRAALANPVDSLRNE